MAGQLTITTLSTNSYYDFKIHTISVERNSEEKLQVLFYKDFVYLLLETGEGRERNTNV